MSKRKDIERALTQGVYRNGELVSEKKIQQIADTVDVADVVKSESSQMTLEEIKDCRRCYTLMKGLPIGMVRGMLERGIPKDMRNKAREFEKAGKPFDANTIVEYYWSESEYRKVCTLAQITKDDISLMAYTAITKRIEENQDKKKSWWRI